MSRYLADASLWARAKITEPTRTKLATRVASGDVVATAPVALEVLHGARNGEEYEELFGRAFAPLEWLPFDQAAAMRALEIQRGLAGTTHGAHRIPAIDYLVAAIAESAGSDVVVWHADRDLARLCEFVGQPHEHERLRRRG
jgi:predicted nucleic acid-binding protein